MSTIATNPTIGGPAAGGATLRLAGGPGMPGFIAGEAQLKRLRERRRVRRMLRAIHDGDWRRVLIDLQVSQYAWPKLQNHAGKIADLLTKVNYVKLACTMHADVLVGTMPTIGVPDGFEGHRDFLAQLERDCALDGLLHSVARKVNVEAEAVLRVDIEDGRTIVSLEDNDRCLPVGRDGADGQPTVWERRWVVERPNPLNPRKPRRFLRVERHRAPGGVGIIEQEAYATDTDDVLLDLARLKRVALAAAFVGVGGTSEAIPAELVQTGATRPLLTRFVQDYYDGEPQFAIQESDLDLIDTVAAAISRLARTHAVHARPKVRIPERAFNNRTGDVDLTGDAIIDPGKEFEYIRVEANLEQMLAFMDRMISQLLVVLQMSQALLGSKLGGGATPESYDKLRLEATNTLSYARRSAVYFGPALERSLATASEIDTIRPFRGYALGPVTVKMNPELPKDQINLAREQSELIAAGLQDRRSALARLYGDDVADAKLEAIEADQAKESARQQAALFGAVPTGGAA